MCGLRLAHGEIGWSGPARWFGWVCLWCLVITGSPAAGETFAAVEDQPTVAISGVNYLDAAKFLGRYGLTAKWVEAGKRQSFASAWTTIELEVDSRELSYNGRRLFLGSGVYGREGRLWIDRIDAEKLLAPLLKPATYAGSAQVVQRIVLDAGHGGRDGGTRNEKRKLSEKTFTLDVVQRLGAILRQQGFEIVYTRTDDTFVGLAERAEQARLAHPDLFVSIHFNSAGSPTVRGIETYALTPRHQRSTASAKADASDHAIESGNTTDPWNVQLAYHIHEALNAKLKGPDRGLKRARFAVLRLASCPAVLVEAGYLSNDEEARKIATPAYRSEIAEAVADGVVAYANQILALRSKS